MPGRYVVYYTELKRVSERRAYAIMRLTIAEVRIVARRNALWRKYPYSGLGRHARPTALANSIYGTLRPDGKGGYIGRVGSDLSYAASVEEGAEPHIIRPRARSFGRGFYGGGPFRGGRLFFYWAKINDIFVGRMVHHPGQKGKHYLFNALRLVGRRRGFIVKKY